MIDLNILKIAGAFVAGVAGIIGILGQTRTQDNKLTRSGKWLFGMAIVGVLLAISTQIWERRKSIEAEQTAQQKNQELLLKLDTDVQLATNSLHEVRRAVTRFQSISFEWYCTFDGSDKLIAPYVQDLSKRVEDATCAYADSVFKEGYQGLHLLSWHPTLRQVHAFKFDANSPAMPDQGKYADLRRYILDTVPEITLFKTRISPANFFHTWPNVRKTLDPLPPPGPDVADLILKLDPGTSSVWVNLDKLGPKISSITVARTHMIASTSSTRGNIISLEDLAGCQGIINLSVFAPKGSQELWKAASANRLNFFVNDQVIAVGNLIPTRTQDGLKHDRLIWSFTVATPTATPATP